MAVMLSSGTSSSPFQFLQSRRSLIYPNCYSRSGFQICCFSSPLFLFLKNENPSLSQTLLFLRLNNGAFDAGACKRPGLPPLLLQAVRSSPPTLLEPCAWRPPAVRVIESTLVNPQHPKISPDRLRPAFASSPSPWPSRFARMPPFALDVSTTAQPWIEDGISVIKGVYLFSFFFLLHFQTISILIGFQA